MANEFHVLFFSLIGGVISLVGGLILVKKKQIAESLAVYATPFAAGVLLATAFSDFLPEALVDQDVRSILTMTLFGVIGFFFLERFLQWFHHHHEHVGQRNRSTNTLIIIGDTLHNAIDGVAIGAAFLVSVPTGIVAAIAVAAHEIPQEIGDFGLLLKNGMDRSKVIIVNVVSALATTVTALTIFSLGTSDSPFIPYLLALASGFFIYIAVSDVIPEIHEKSPSRKDIRPWLLLLGALLILIISPLAHDYIDASHKHAAEDDQHLFHGAEEHTKDNHDHL